MKRTNPDTSESFKAYIVVKVSDTYKKKALAEIKKIFQPVEPVSRKGQFYAFYATSMSLDLVDLDGVFPAPNMSCLTAPTGLPVHNSFLRVWQIALLPASKGGSVKTHSVWKECVIITDSETCYNCFQVSPRPKEPEFVKCL